MIKGYILSCLIAASVILSAFWHNINGQSCPFSYSIQAELISQGMYEVSISHIFDDVQPVPVQVYVDGSLQTQLTGIDGTTTFNLADGYYQICFQLTDAIQNCSESYCENVALGSSCGTELNAEVVSSGNVTGNLSGAGINPDVIWTLQHLSGAQVSGSTGSSFLYTLSQPGTYQLCAQMSSTQDYCFGVVCDTLVWSMECEAAFSINPLNYSGSFQFISQSTAPTTGLNVQYTWFIDTLDIFIETDTQLTYQFTTPGIFEVCHTASYFNTFGELVCSNQACENLTSPPGCDFDLEVVQTFQYFTVAAVNMPAYMQGDFIYEVIRESDTMTVTGQSNLFVAFPLPGEYQITLFFESFDGVCVYDQQTVVSVGGNNDDCPASFTWVLYEELSSGQFGIQFTNNSPTAHEFLAWDFGDGSQVDSIVNNQLIHFYDQPGMYYACMTLVTEDQCTSYVCQQIIFDPYGNICDFMECIYPGDANHDGIVDATDVLAIGLAYGTSGHVRPNAHLNWLPQASLNWNMTVGAHTFDFKHIDTDGSGVIDESDLEAIDLNYHQEHDDAGIDKPLSPDAEPMLFVDIIGVSEEQVGSNIHYKITSDFFVGSDIEPAQGFYGIALSLEYHTEFPAEAVLAEVIHMDNVLTGNGEDALLFYKHLPDLNRLDIAIVRKDQKNKSSNSQQRIARGDITLIGDIIGRPDTWDSETIEVPFTIEVLWVYAINNLGEDLQYFGIGDEVMLTILQSASEQQKDITTIHIHPNPSDGHFYLSSEATLLEVEVYNAMGQRVASYNVPQGLTTVFTMDLGHLPSGAYWVRCLTAQGLGIQKVILY